MRADGAAQADDAMPRWRAVAEASGLAAPDGTARPTVFAEISALALETGAANLGQGFPDADGPEWIREVAVQAIRDGINQYPAGRGSRALRVAVAEHQRSSYGIELDPEREVLVTAGATEAIASALLAFTGPGDEVVTLEPFYDSHAASIAMAGATHVTVPLVPVGGGFVLDTQALETAVGERTRVILVNTPHNPTGAVLTGDELAAIAAAAKRVDAIVVTDEVYEHLVFDGNAHTPLATLPGMAERTLTISSAGKTFSLTGWKVGWVTGPAELLDAVMAIKQFVTYSGGAPFQPAIARALTEGAGDIAELRDSLASRRDLLVQGLRDAGFDLVVPGGTYFVCADATPFLGEDLVDGADFARALPASAGVACIPVSALCREGSATAEALKNWVRFTFVKDESTIRTAIERLGGLRRR